MEFYRGPTGNAFPKRPDEMCSRCRFPAAAHRRDQNRERMVCPEIVEPRGAIVGVGRDERGWTVPPTDATSSAPVPKYIQKRMRAAVARTLDDERFSKKAELMEAVRLLDEAQRQLLSAPRIRELEERVARIRNQIIRESRDEQIYMNADAPRVIFDPDQFFAGRRSGKSQLMAAAGRVEKKKKTAPKPSTAPSNQPRRYYEE